MQKKDSEVEELQNDIPQPGKFATFKQLCERYPGVCTEGGVRHQVYHADKNGLEASGALSRLGSKLIFDVPRYFRWVKSPRSVKK